MNWREVPIPDQTKLRARRGSRTHPINLGSIENTECAVNILTEGIAGENYYHHIDNPPYWLSAPGSIPELYVRDGIIKRLFEVNAVLSPLGYELYVFDAYRPVEVQTYFHDVWVPNYLRVRNPDWSEEKILGEVGNYWARGYPDSASIDPLSPPPHTTGGVVDLTLRNLRTHEQLFMGSYFDDVSSISFADHFEREGEKRILSMSEELARGNRRILYHAMTSAGFLVNPNEWWHFGFGDQLSAWNSDSPHAVYSVMHI